MRKTLVFYKGRAPHGQKSDWIMHEYRLDDTTNSSYNPDSDHSHVTSAMNGELAQEEGWVVCRIFKKKNHIKTLDSPINTLEAHSSMLDSSRDHDEHDHHDDQGALEQIFQFMGTNKLQKNNSNNTTTSTSSHHQIERFMKLPSLDSPNNSSQVATYQIPIHIGNDVFSTVKSGTDPNSVFNSESGLGDWASLDRFVATHLNGQTTSETMASIFSSSSADHNDHDHEHLQLPPLRSSSSTSSANKIYQPAATLDNYGGTEIDLWSFTRSSLAVDPLCHVSDAGL